MHHSPLGGNELARFRLELGPIPFYHQVYLDLRAMIDDGRWPAGHQVPPERELAKSYGVSLITIRRALDELAREQRVERTRGRGTFVLAPIIERDLDEPLSFNEEMQRRGMDAQTRLIASRPEPSTEVVAAALGIEPGSPTLYVERLRVADDEPLLLEQVHLPAERFPGLLASDLEAGSLYQLLTDRYGTDVARARETFEPVLLKTREALLLGVKARQPALLIEGIAFSSAGVPVEFARTYVRGDRTRYFLERSVRVNRDLERPRPQAQPRQESAARTAAVALASTGDRGGEQS
jgi:GntR family transcriptional regulator